MASAFGASVFAAGVRRARAAELSVEASVEDESIDVDGFTTLEVTVTNVGSETSERIDPTVYAEGGETYLEEISSLAPGESRTVETHITGAGSEGEVEVTVEAVDIDRNRDSDTVRVTVGEVESDLVLSSNDPVYVPGQETEIELGVENRGAATVEDAYIFFDYDELRDLGNTVYDQDFGDYGRGWDPPGWWGHGVGISPGETVEPKVRYDVDGEEEPRVVELTAELYPDSDRDELIDDTVVRFVPRVDLSLNAEADPFVPEEDAEVEFSVENRGETVVDTGYEVVVEAEDGPETVWSGDESVDAGGSVEHTGRYTYDGSETEATALLYVDWYDEAVAEDRLVLTPEEGGDTGEADTGDDEADGGGQEAGNGGDTGGGGDEEGQGVGTGGATYFGAGALSALLVYGIYRRFKKDEEKED